MEVGHALNVFMESLEQRRDNSFLSTAVQNEIEAVAVNDASVTKERVLLTTKTFYGLFFKLATSFEGVNVDFK